MSQRFDLGVHYTLQGDHAKAVRAFQEVLVDDPQNARAWAYLGVALSHLGRAAEAEASLSRAVSLQPGNPEAWFHLGVARSLRSEWPEAASAYRHAVALEPDDMVAWHRLGVALSESGDEPAASVAFERALVLSRETGDTPLEEPITTLPEQGHLVEAGERESSREAQSWLDLGLSLLSLGEEEEAIAAYERAYTIDPERARRSLFRPMLQLVSAASGHPSDLEPGDEGESPTGPARPEPPYSPPPRDRRPEVA